MYNVRHLKRLQSAACISLLWLRLLSCHALSKPPGPSTGVVLPPPSLNRCLLLVAAGSNTGPSMDSEPLRCVSTGSAYYAKGPLTCMAGTPTPRLAQQSSSSPRTLLARGLEDHPGLLFVAGLTGGASPRKHAAAAAKKAHSSAPANTANQKPPPPSSLGVRHTPTSSTINTTNSPWPEVRRVLKRCLVRAGSGGLPGAAAGVLQVLTLMWMRTVINYQYRYGTSLAAAISELYRQGGVMRFYQGISFALVSNPLARFGMAAANEGAMALRDALPWPVSVAVTTWVASLLAGVWRMVLTPLDTCKTVLQVEGSKGFALLMAKVR
ncbi:unnamed protein product, partial [Laminaria digitata]